MASGGCDLKWQDNIKLMEVRQSLQKILGVTQPRSDTRPWWFLKPVFSY